jgi:L-cysteine S-thiosulfotransferase
MRRLVRGIVIGLSLYAAVLAAPALAADWPDSTHLSGNAFLPPGLLRLQADAANSPVTLWLDKGRTLWSDGSMGPSCQSCHGAVDSLKHSAPSYPRMAKDGQSLINLDDQIVACRARSGRLNAKIEDDDVLALSAVLHDVAKGQPINVQAPADQAAAWQAHLTRGAQLFSTRNGRINLACVHCHEQNVGRQMRADVISPGNPTGFPIYRMSWQRLGSIERRLRACYSGVQAVLPPPGDPDLRDLELYLKVRASGMPLDGPSIRR